MEKRALIYIGGYGRSGSTLLDCFLSSGEGVVGVGEATNLFDDISRDAFCACGVPLRQCEFWSPFLSRWARDEFLKLGRQISSVEGMSFFHSKRVKECYSRFWQSFFSHVDSRVVVDSSKTTRKSFTRFSRISPFFSDHVFILLYKQPERLVLSLRNGSNKGLAGRAKRSQGIIFLMKSLLGWVIGMLGALCSAWTCRGTVIAVDYDEFCKSPHFLLEVLSDAGIPLSAPAGRLSGGHGISGNRMRGTVTEVRPPVERLEKYTALEWFLIAAMRIGLKVANRLLPKSTLHFSAPIKSELDRGKVGAAKNVQAAERTKESA